MGKKDDIYSAYYDMDEMLDSIDIKKDDIIDDTDEVVVIEDDANEIDDDIEVLDIDLEKTQKIELPDNIDEIENTFIKDGIIIEDNAKDESISNEDNKVESVSDEVSNNENIDTNDKLAEIDNIFKDEEIEDKKPKKEKAKKERKDKKDKSKKKKRHKLVITLVILDVITIVCLFLMYGPIAYFRNIWVTSAMSTMSHKYFAYIFFNEGTINKIMSNNAVIESGKGSDANGIGFDNADPGVYSSIYEEQILKRDAGNDLYKVLDIEGNGYKGHMLVVYDPSRISLAQASNIKYGGRQLEKLVAENNAIAGTNASGFSVTNSGLVPTGIVIMNGKVVFDGGGTGWGGGIVGFTKENRLVLTKSSSAEALKMGIRDAVSFGPFLIVDGVPSEFKGNGGYGLAPRTAIAQRKDGTVLMLVIDGRRPGHSIGIDMVELTNILLNYGAYNASNLDGGGSSSIVVNNEVLSVAGGYGYSGERYLPNGWILK